MDLTSIITTVLTVALSVTTISAFVIKWSGKLSKWVRVAHDGTGLAEDLIESLKDGNVTPAEIAQFEADLAKIKADIAS